MLARPAACRLAWLGRQCASPGLHAQSSPTRGLPSVPCYSICAASQLSEPASSSEEAQAPPLASGGASPAAAAATAPSPIPPAVTPADDERYMRLALQQAATAAAADEVPVGAVLVSAQGEVLAAAGNTTETSADPTAHAELLCIRQAATAAGAWRLLDATLYVTLEPCPMCAGALLQARVGTVVYGARNTLLGADGSWISMLPTGAADAGSGHGSSSDSSIDSGRSDGGSSSAEQPSSCSCTNDGSQQAGSSQPAAEAAAGRAVRPAVPARPHPFHPNMAVRRGVLAKECSSLMKAFFARRRKEAAAAKRSSMGSDTS